MLKYIANKMRETPRVMLGKAEALPFADNSFDVVALITSFEFVKDGKTGLEEAFRVARKKVALGVLNKMSYLNFKRRLLAPIKKSVFLKIRFYSIFELNRLIMGIASHHVDWGSVLTLPLGWHKFARPLDGVLSFWKNPLGAFLGLVIEVGKKEDP
jgi:hypothetical protein